MTLPAVTIPPVKLLLLDGYVLFRQALTSLLRPLPWVAELRETGSVAEALRCAVGFQPQLAVVDLKLPGTSGLAAVRELPRVAPACRVLVLTEDGDEVLVTQALAAGASGYALKSEPFSQIAHALGRVLEGERYLADPLAPAAALPPPGRRPASPRSGLDDLTARERTVFEMLVGGQTNGEIAETLGISVKTVETHRTRVLRKLGLHSMAELILFAVRHQVPVVAMADRARSSAAVVADKLPAAAARGRPDEEAHAADWPSTAA